MRFTIRKLSSQSGYTTPVTPPDDLEMNTIPESIIDQFAKFPAAIPKVVKLVTTSKKIISEPYPPLNLPSPEVDAFRASMKQLLDMILVFFEEEQKQVDQGILELENTLLADVQEDNTDPQFNTRPVPENFKRLRA